MNKSLEILDDLISSDGACYGLDCNHCPLDETCVRLQTREENDTIDDFMSRTLKLAKKKKMELIFGEIYK